MTAGEILAKRECWIDETVNKLQKNLMRRPDTQSRLCIRMLAVINMV